jgi:hypothetical protein
VGLKLNETYQMRACVDDVRLIGDNIYTINKTEILMYAIKEGPPLWSSGQSSWLQIRRPGFDSQHYQKKSNGSGTGSTQPREYN